MVTATKIWMLKVILMLPTHFHKRVILILKEILRVDAVVKKKNTHSLETHKSKLMHKTCLLGCFHKLLSINFSKQ